MEKSLKTNYIFNLINTITGLLFPLVTFPYITRVISPEGIGQVNFYLSIITYISMFTCLGIPTYALRETARLKETGNFSKFVCEIISLQILLTILGYVVVFILCISVKEINCNIPLFLLLSLNILLISIGSEWFYQGIEDFKYITIRAVAVRIISAFLLFIFVKTTDDLFLYGVYCVFGVAGGNILNFVRLKKYINFSTIDYTKISPLRHLIGAIKLFMIGLIASFYLQLDTVMLGFLAGNESVGYYSGAMKITKTILGITSSLAIVILPRLTSVERNNDEQKFSQIVIASTLFVFAISLPLAIILLFLSNSLIVLFCGYSFIPAIETLRIIAPIILFISISYILAQSLYAKGKEKLTIYTGCVGATVNIICNYFFIPKWQQNGAALGSLFAECGVMIAYLIICRAYFHKISIIIHGCKILASGVALFISLYLLNLYINNMVLKLIVFPTVGSFIYLYSQYLLREDLLTKNIEKMYVSIKKRIK